MTSYLKKALFIILSFSGLLFYSCTDDSLSIGKQFIHSTTYTELIDTVSLRLSTFRADSLETSSKSVALVGNYETYGLGNAVAASYMSFTNEYADDIEDHENFDSLTITLKYSGYSKGDTLKPFKIRIHRLLDTLQTNFTTDVFYNTSHFQYSSPIDSFTFYPRPNRGKDLEFKMNKALGEELWQLIDEQITNTKFESYFKGIVLTCDQEVSHTVLGFSAADTTGLTLNLYSHKNADLDQATVRRIGIKDVIHQYNQIKSSNAIADMDTKLTKQNYSISETATNNITFIQCGTGYFTRIDFPFLSDLQEFNERGRIVQATLLIKPVTTYTAIKDLPSSISISTINKLNVFESYVLDSYGNTQTGDLYPDYESIDGNYTYYAYDITSFINTQLAKDVIQDGDGLALSFPSEEIYATVNSLQLGGFTNKNFQSQLLIYYYNYDKEE